jgi:hypothetical protein
VGSRLAASSATVTYGAERRATANTSLTPVLFELGRAVELDGVGADDFQFGTAGGTVNDLSDFEVVVQGHVCPTLDAFCHCSSSCDRDPLKAFEHIRIV